MLPFFGFFYMIRILLSQRVLSPDIVECRGVSILGVTIINYDLAEVSPMTVPRTPWVSQETPHLRVQEPEDGAFWIQEASS